MLEKKSKKIVIACAAVAVMLVGGAAAYFTATDTATNTWTIGNVAIDLQEPEYDASDKDNIVPGQELDKDPMVENTGTNDAYVFMKLSIPKANVSTVDEDGSLIAQAVQELFSYGISDGWVLVNQVQGAESNTYVYAYGTADECTVLPADGITPVLFKDGKIRFLNIVEGQLGDSVSIPVTAYAIQTENITADGSKAPADVWAVVSGQLDN